MRLPTAFIPVLMIVTALVSLMAMRVAGAPNVSLFIQAAAFVLAVLAALPKRVGATLGGIDARWLCGAVALVAGAVLFAGVEIDGARRWLRIGPVLIHPASLLGSVLLLALVRAPGDTLCAMFSGVAVLCFGLGNDGAASLAFALGLGALLLGEQKHWKTLLPLCMLALGLAAWGWTRPDSLAPVGYVEEIIGRSAMVSMPLGVAAACLLALLPLSFLAAAGRNARRRSVGYALAGFWLGLAVAGLVGNYPVPLLGYGASPVIGWALAMGMLLNSRSA